MLAVLVWSLGCGRGRPGSASVADGLAVNRLLCIADCFTLVLSCALSVYGSFCLSGSVCLSVCPPPPSLSHSASLLGSLSLCLCLSLSVSLSLSPLSLSLSSPSLSLCLPDCLSIRLQSSTLLMPLLSFFHPDILKRPWRISTWTFCPVE